MTYQLIRSKRKTLGMEIGKKGLVVRAPLQASIADIEAFVAANRAWIVKHTAIQEERQKKLAQVEPLTWSELEQLAQRACQVVPERVRYYAPLLGVHYRRITIRNQQTKWGSCSAQGNLNFNVMLMLSPPKVLDSVVVHELCHLKIRNHSPQFYALVEQIFPEYWECDRWLKENGNLLMARMPREERKATDAQEEK